MLLNNSLYISHKYIKEVVRPGDTVVDATCGNGHDTLFLSELVGINGKVYSFDIQKQAIENGKARLSELGKYTNTEFILDGHENMKKYVSSATAAMFNFGYLPSGDHSIGTKAETSIAAIKSALDIIKTGGIVMLVIYYGGDSGFDEKNALCDFIKTIDFKQFSVLKHEYVNQPNCPPIAVCIEKLK